jgi:hypothetical protein
MLHALECVVEIVGMQKMRLLVVNRVVKALICVTCIVRMVYGIAEFCGTVGSGFW